VKNQGTRTLARVRLLMRGDRRVAWTWTLAVAVAQGRCELRARRRQVALSTFLTLGQAVHQGKAFPNVRVGKATVCRNSLTSEQNPKPSICIVRSNLRTPQRRSIQRGTSSPRDMASLQVPVRGARGGAPTTKAVILV
jgi:hypothetical protein